MGPETTRNPREPATREARFTRRSPSRRSRRHDAALLVPIGGGLFILPPIAGFFGRPETVFGLPLVVLYLFGLWLGLIAIAFHLSRLLQTRSDERRSGEER
jgi:hypothetical protein